MALHTIQDVQTAIAAKSLNTRLTAIEQPYGYATLFWQNAPLTVADTDGSQIPVSVTLDDAYDIFNGIPTLQGLQATIQQQIVQQLFRTYNLGYQHARGG